MKKLSLKTAKNVLSRKEMKAISGGYDGPDCDAAKFIAYSDALNAGFTPAEASAASYSVYFSCMSLQF